jgi:hypothetical protein
MRNNKKEIKPEVEEQNKEPEVETKQQPEPEGTIFDSITYYKSSDLDNFMLNLTSEQALYCLLQACQSAYKRNVFTIVESELLSKSIRKLTS